MLSKGLSVFCSWLQSFCLGLFLSRVAPPVFRSVPYIFPQIHCTCKLAGGPIYPRDVFPMFMSICNSEESLTFAKGKGKLVTENPTWNRSIIKTKRNYSGGKHLREKHHGYFYTWFFKTGETLPLNKLISNKIRTFRIPLHTHTYTLESPRETLFQFYPWQVIQFPPLSGATVVNCPWCGMPD